MEYIYFNCIQSTSSFSFLLFPHHIPFPSPCPFPPSFNDRLSQMNAAHMHTDMVFHCSVIHLPGPTPLKKTVLHPKAISSYSFST